MQTVTMEEAKAQLPELLEAAAKSHLTFMVLDEGGNVLTVSVARPADSPAFLPRRAGFMKGEIVIPDDINKYDDEVAEMFGLGE